MPPNMQDPPLHSPGADGAVVKLRGCRAGRRRGSHTEDVLEPRRTQVLWAAPPGERDSVEAEQKAHGPFVRSVDAASTMSVNGRARTACAMVSGPGTHAFSCIPKRTLKSASASPEL